jgi:hypothetical protein
MSDTRWAVDRADRGRSFGAVAADYAAWRPGYPADVVAFLAGASAGHDRPRRILDLGAGTGLLTEAWSPRDTTSSPPTCRPTCWPS